MSAVHALKLMGLDAAAEDILSRISGPHPKIKDTLPKKVQVARFYGKLGSKSSLELTLSTYHLFQQLLDADDEVVYGRKAMRVQKTKQYFLRFTDKWAGDAFEEMWLELVEINRFLQLYLLVFTTKTNSTEQDEGPIVFVHAEVPEIMLDVLKLSFDPEFFLDNPKRRCLPYLAIEVIAGFLHKTMPTFDLVSERLFRSLTKGVMDIADVLFGKLSWVETLAAVRFFGVASFHPVSSLWLHKYPDIYEEICRWTYRSVQIVEEKIANGEINNRDENLVSLITTFRAGEDLVESARLMGLHTLNHAILAWHHMMCWCLRDQEIFIHISAYIRKANVLGNFSFILKQMMTWIEPGQFMNSFMAASRCCLNTPGGFEDLFLADFAYCRENNISLGVESLKYWNHPKLWPSRIGWMISHGLSLDDTFGCGWCISILHFVLMYGPEEVSSTIIRELGPWLMDLAHLLDNEHPTITRVQPGILEALLRYAGISHRLSDRSEKLYLKVDTYDGTMVENKDLPEFCLEAALFCRRASLEQKLSISEKQKRVRMADGKKDLGNQAFKAGKYRKAIDLYTEALSICPLTARTKQALYYSNRAECQLRCNDPLRAVHDCNRSFCLDKSSKVKVLWRRSRAYQQLKLIYPAWLDMKCIERSWNLTKEQSHVDFPVLLNQLSQQIGMMHMESGVVSGRELMRSTGLEHHVWPN